MSEIARPWPLAQRVAFRFAALYFGLYAVVDGNSDGFPLILFNKDGDLPDWYTKPIDAVVAAAGHMVGLKGTISAADNGSGDRLGNYVLLGCVLFACTVGTAAWSWLDRDRPDYRRALDWLRILVRYDAAGTMLVYGVAKVLPTQFSLPGPLRLMEPYGASSPMGLLWTFMGASPAYTMFAGWAETVGALLLFGRRTTTIGALILVAVLANVVMLNLCYDVPVKLESSHLLVMALFLVLPQSARLLDVFVRHRAVPPEDLGVAPLASGSRRARIARAVMKPCLVVAMIAAPAAHFSRYYFASGNGAPRSPIDGIYDVEELRRDGEIAPPLLTDARYWRRVAVSKGFARVVHGDGSSSYFGVAYDASTGRGTLTARDASFALTLARRDDGKIDLDGTVDGARVVARACPTDPSNGLLLRRGFHWVSEAPFNR